MSEHTISPEITYAPKHDEGTKRIWVTFWILSAITVAELALGLGIYFISEGNNPSAGLILFFKGVVCILTLAKAYYIVAVFMHLGSEIRNFIMTVIVPLTLFIWFIIAFLWDGAAWRDLKNTDAGSRPAVEQTTPAVKQGHKD